MKVFASIWNKLGSIHLTVVLSFLLTIDLTVGYICMNRRTFLFAPLNDIGLASWVQTYGIYNLTDTMWFFILLGLLTLLCINTFICTTDRVVSLVRRRGHFSRQRMLFKFAPHIMHYAMIVILIGYLCSYLFSTVLNACTLIPDMPVKLPGTSLQLLLKEVRPEYYLADRLPAFHNRVMQPGASLTISDGKTEKNAELNYNQPVRFHGYTIFLKDFAPKTRGGGMNPSIRVDLTVRKDPGVLLYFVGIILFTVGLVMYVVQWGVFRKTDTEPVSFTVHTVGDR